MTCLLSFYTQKGLDGVLRQLERVHRELITKTDYMPKDPILELQVMITYTSESPL